MCYVFIKLIVVTCKQQVLHGVKGLNNGIHYCDAREQICGNYITGSDQKLLLQQGD